MATRLDIAIDAALRTLLSNPPHGGDNELIREEALSTVYSRAAAVAARLAVQEAFYERLLSTDGEALGLCESAALTSSGKAFRQLILEEYERAESHTEMVIRARARVNHALLVWSFTSDEHTACLILACRDTETAAAAVKPPNVLLRVDASRPAGTERAPGRVLVRASLLDELDRRFFCSGLDATTLIHVLVGFLPEMTSAEWYEECYAHVVDALKRRERRRTRRARLGRGPADRPRWWCRHTKRRGWGSWLAR